MWRVGVDLGGTKIQTVVVNNKNKVRGQDRRPTPRDNGPKGVADAIAAAVAAAIKDSERPKDKVMGIGVGSPGQIDRRLGTVANAGNLPDWQGSYPLGTELSKLTGLPVDIGNDVQVAVRSEAELGAGEGFNSFIGVFLGTGIGGGIVINKKMWLGRGAAGEIGHTVVDANGAPCPCGRLGCLEAYAGRAAMENYARELQADGRETILFDIMRKKGRERLTSGVWAKALKKKDPLATELIDRAVWALGNGIGSAVNLLDCDAVIIGGGLGIRFGQDFADRLAKAALPRMIKPERAPEFVVAELGDLGGAIGASLLPLD